MIVVSQNRAPTAAQHKLINDLNIFFLFDLNE